MISIPPWSNYKFRLRIHICYAFFDFNPTLSNYKPDRRSDRRYRSRFQSHPVQLQDTLATSLRRRHRYFNPTLVQLQDFYATNDQALADNFNPTLVQLQAADGDHVPRLTRISIPPWSKLQGSGMDESTHPRTGHLFQSHPGPITSVPFEQLSPRVGSDMLFQSHPGPNYKSVSLPR